jgi:hypothetical protein
MNKSFLTSLTACAAAALMLSACNRAESPSEVSADVEEAQAERQDSVADARVDQAEVQSDTAEAATSRDPDDRGDAMEDRAEAQYNTALAEAQGDLDVAKQGCESLRGDAQASCKQSAEAAFQAARSDARSALEAERRRSEQTQAIDN